MNDERLKKLDIITRVVSNLGLRVVIMVALVLLFWFGATRAYKFGYSLFTQQTMEASPGRDITVTITEGMTNAQVGDLMAAKGLASSSLSFQVFLKLYSKKVYPGTYVLNTSMSSQEMAEAISVVPSTTAETTALAASETTTAAPAADPTKSGE